MLRSSSFTALAGAYLLLGLFLNPMTLASGAALPDDVSAVKVASQEAVGITTTP